jgi:hypothetical protein
MKSEGIVIYMHVGFLLTWQKPVGRKWIPLGWSAALVSLLYSMLGPEKKAKAHKKQAMHT